MLYICSLHIIRTMLPEILNTTLIFLNLEKLFEKIFVPFYEIRQNETKLAELLNF